MVSQLWRLEVQDQGVVALVPSEVCEGTKNLFHPSLLASSILLVISDVCWLAAFIFPWQSVRSDFPVMLD